MREVVFRSGNTWSEVIRADNFIVGILDMESRYPTPTAELVKWGGRDPDSPGWDGWIRLMHRPKTKPAWFPTGLIPRFTEICRKFGYTAYCEDLRERPMEGFPEHVGEEIIDRDYQLTAAEIAVKVGRGVLDMPPRCHAKGEKVLLSDGRRLRVEQIVVGDFLLGPDGTPREVLEIHSGDDDLYRVTPSKWVDPFVVNGAHPLVIKRNVRLWHRFEWRDEIIPVCEFFQKTKNWKRRTYLQFADVVEFPDGVNSLPIDPYLLGLLLGDGYLNKTPEISSEDPKIQSEALLRGRAMGLTGCCIRYPRDHCPKVILGNGAEGSRSNLNPLTESLRGLGLWGKTSGTKFVPDAYLRSTVSARRVLLAGLVDTDGHLANETYFEFVTKSDRLAQGVQFLAGSLGLRTSVGEKLVDGRTYFRVNICGNIASIPTVLSRKKSTHLGRAQDSRVSFSVEKLGRGRFYGFTVSGDHLYLDDEFIIQHNSGKTRTMLEIHRRLALATVWTVPTDRIAQQTLSVARSFFGEHYAMHLIGNPAAGASTTEKALRIKREKVEKAANTRLVICTAATAAALDQEFYQTREMLVVDEWHHGASKTYTKEIFPKCDHIYFRYGMTGTHFRSGEDKLAMHGLLSNVIHKVYSRDLLRMGYLVPTRVCYLPMPAHPKLRGLDTNSFISGHGKHGIHQHKGRNQLVTHATFYAYHAGRKPLILVGTKAQGYAIKRMLDHFIPQAGDGCQFDSVEFVSTDKPRPRQGEILESYLNDQEVKVLIGTSLLGEGVDLPSADALIYARGEKAAVSLTQNAYRVGTADGIKKDAVLIDFADRHNSKLMKHSHQRLDVLHREDTFTVDVLQDVNQYRAWLGA